MQLLMMQLGDASQCYNKTTRPLIGKLSKKHKELDIHEIFARNGGG